MGEGLEEGRNLEQHIERSLAGWENTEHRISTLRAQPTAPFCLPKEGQSASRKRPWLKVTIYNDPFDPYHIKTKTDVAES